MNKTEFLSFDEKIQLVNDTWSEYLHNLNAERAQAYQATKEAQKERERAQAVNEAREAAKAAKEERKAKTQKIIASSNLQFIDHRIKQLENLIEIEQEKRAGTLYGGKEWKKYEKSILSYEKQLQSLNVQRMKNKLILTS